MNQFSTTTDLDLLFRRAAGSEPELKDANFTKMVLNQLPAKESTPGRNWLPDFTGLLVGLLAVWWWAESKGLPSLSATLPEKLVISEYSLAILMAAMAATALLGWWIVERDH